jgi:hypothetical protein
MNKLYLLAKKEEINKKATIVEEQEMLIYAPIEKVWESLADIGEWPEWYTGVAIRKPPRKVEEGQRFYWKRDDLRIKSRLAKVEKPNSLTWTGSVFWIKAVHVWKLEKLEKNKTKVMVKESMQGFLISQFMTKDRLHKSLNLWLNLLKIRAEKDNPQPQEMLRGKKTPSRYGNMLRGIHVLS